MKSKTTVVLPALAPVDKRATTARSIASKPVLAAIVPSFRAPHAGAAVFLHDDALEPTAVDWVKVFRLFTGRQYAGQCDRQAAVLLKLARHYSGAGGLVASHLASLYKLVALVSEKLASRAPETAALEQPLCALLAQFSQWDNSRSLPPPELLQMALGLLELDLQSVTLAVMQLLSVFASAADSQAYPGDDCVSARTDAESAATSMDMRAGYVFPAGTARPVPVNLSAAGRGDTSEATAHRANAATAALFASVPIVNAGLNVLRRASTLQAVSEKEREIVALTIGLLDRLVAVEEHAAELVADADTLEVLCRIVLCSTGNPDVQLASCNILWTLLGTESPTSEIRQLAVSHFCTTDALSLVIDCIEACSGQPQTNELRNEATGTLLLALQSVDMGILLEAQESNGGEPSERMLAQLQRIARLCATLLIEHDVALLETQTADDADFRCMLLELATIATADPACTSILQEHGLVQFAQLYLVDAATGNAEPSTNAGRALQTQFSLRHIKEIQLQLLTLFSLRLEQLGAPLRAAGGVGWATQFLRHAAALEYGVTPLTDVRGHLVHLIPATLRHIAHVVEADRSTAAEFGQHGLVQMLLTFLRETVALPVETLRLLLGVCAQLCAACPANQRRFGRYQGPATVSQYLLFQSCSTAEYESVHFVAIEALWAGVCGNAENEQAFLELGGVFEVLNNLEAAPAHGPLRAHHVGFLIDLLSNPLVRAHMLQWRDREKRQKTVVHLLLRLWQDEDRALGVEYDALGLLPDSPLPLIGARQADTLDARVLRVRGVPEPASEAAKDLAYGLRGKLYALLAQLGFETFAETLSPSERRQLMVISKFLDFKLGEVWQEIDAELRHDRLRPVTPDAQCIELAHTVNMQKVRTVRKQQQAVLDHELQLERDDEARFFRSSKARALVQLSSVRG